MPRKEIVGKAVTPKLVYLEWADHYSDASDAWKNSEEVAKSMDMLICASVGWVIAEDKNQIRIVSTVSNIEGDSQDCVDGVMTILKACIIRKRVLKNWTNAKPTAKRAK